ncbi:MAG TPA: hypothetical protein PLJ38_10395 [bacterium]|nr:hypothetical protein [bacterium]
MFDNIFRIIDDIEITDNNLNFRYKCDLSKSQSAKMTNILYINLFEFCQTDTFKINAAIRHSLIEQMRLNSQILENISSIANTRTIPILN